MLYVNAPQCYVIRVTSRILFRRLCVGTKPMVAVEFLRAIFSKHRNPIRRLKLHAVLKQFSHKETLYMISTLRNICFISRITVLRIALPHRL